MRFAAVISLLLFSMLSFPALARDVAGGRDHELVGRYEGATMTLYKTRDYEEQRLLVKPIRSADLRAAGRRLSDANSLSISGKAYRIRYQGRPDGLRWKWRAITTRNSRPRASRRCLSAGAGLLGFRRFGTLFRPP